MTDTLAIAVTTNTPTIDLHLQLRDIIQKSKMDSGIYRTGDSGKLEPLLTIDEAVLLEQLVIFIANRDGQIFLSKFN